MFADVCLQRIDHSLCSLLQALQKILLMLQRLWLRKYFAPGRHGICIIFHVSYDKL